MTKPSSILFLSGASLFAFVLASGCGSDKCEDTDSCGSFPQAGATAAGNGNSSNAGRSGSGTGGSSAGSSGKGGSSGSSNVAGNTGESGQAGAGGESGSGAVSGLGGESGQAGTGTAGAGGSDPCDGACTGATPVCNPDTADCVECTKRSHCGGDTPVCDNSTNTCVQCTADDSSACDGDTPVCDTASSQCVACLTTDDCSSPVAPLCANDSCVPCTSNDDCTHLSGTAICNAGTCVQCTLSDESACGANSCDPATNTCTATPRGSVHTCEPCVADSECSGGDQPDPDARCVPMNFQGVPREGGFCLRRVASTCGRQFQIITNAMSLSGSPAEDYCGIDETVTRCEAVVDLGSNQTCSDGADTSCGCARDSNGNCTEPGEGGLCRTVGPNENRCTYACGTNEDCPQGKICDGAPTKYCQ